MSLEISRSHDIDLKGKQICGGCSVLVTDTHIHVGAVVMVKPSSETHRVTNWGDSQFHGKVLVPFENAIPEVDEKGVIHYLIPTAIETTSVAGALKDVIAYKHSKGHELAVFP